MSADTFTFDGRELAYARHRYNRTALNMRTVEVPIVLAIIREHEHDWAGILEVGNVLSHYGPVVWPVLDAREVAEGVINADVMRWQPARPLDLIVSISTVEHVGFGKYAHLAAPCTPADVVARLRSWLAPGGRAVITVPLGYNLVLDRQLEAGLVPVDEVRCMRRVSAPARPAPERGPGERGAGANEWAECSLAEALAAERPAGYPWSVAMAVLTCRAEGKLDILNLGAGRRPIKGAVNHDLRLDPDRPFITVAHDLNVLPWPWADQSFDRVIARAVLEHLDIDLLHSFDECWRLLRPGGLLYVKLPYWNSELAHSDVTHRWFVSLASFDQFDPARRRGREYEFYTDRHWKIVKGPRLNDARSSIHVSMEVRK